MGIARAGVQEPVRPVAAVADGFACPCGARLFADGDLDLAGQQIEMLDGARRVRIGFEHAARPCLEVVPLDPVDQVERAGNGQPA